MPIGAIPYPLGVGAGSSGTYTATGFAYNYAIGGLPFLSAASREHPIVRKTAPYRKQQFDNSNEPGEQSLEGWWLRSQQSFHAGAGQLYGDPGTGDPSFNVARFFDSVGVDPWTPGQLKLLRSTSLLDSTPLTKVIGTASNGDAFGITQALGLWNISGSTDIVTLEGSPVATPLDVTADQVKYYVAGYNDGIYSRTAGSVPGAWTKIWNLAAAQIGVVIKVVKERLVMAATTGVYELASGGPALPTPKWSAPGGTWQPTAIAEGANSIYVAGTGADGSIILRFTVDSSGVMPTLTSGILSAQLPFTERIYSMYGFLGRYLAIGTDQGARIAVINSDGTLELGPLLFTGLQVYSWTSEGQFLYCTTFDPTVTSGARDLYRIDVGLEVDSLRFAYARDLRVDNPGNPVAGYTPMPSTASYGMSIPAIGGAPGPAKMLIVTNSGVFKRDDTYVTSGYLQTSRIRFDTLEPKVYKFVRVRGQQTPADFYVSIIDDLDNESSVVGYVSSQIPGLEDADIPNIGPQDFVSLKFTLSSATSRTVSAQCSGYQLKALPASPRKRMLQIPVWCFDSEQDRLGVMSGFEGSAVGRVLALEDLDEAADVVNLQDLDRATSERVVIDDVEFVQSAPPDGFDGWGGIITLTLRTV